LTFERDGATAPSEGIRGGIEFKLPEAIAHHR
jgi:hypothetical protein